MFLFLLGTRPEIIKVAPVLRAMAAKKVPFLFAHSNQHYSSELDTVFLKELALPAANFNLRVGSGTHAVQTGKIMIAFEEICKNVSPSAVIVHGDTNTALAGALVAKKCQLKLAHIEAGLRSGDMNMPEEVNRITIDHIADFLFAPTQDASNNLTDEGINAKRVFQTGNTIVDAVKQHIQFCDTDTVFQEMPVKPGFFILATSHRPSNVDTKKALQELVSLLAHASKQLSLPVLWPAHPRAKTALDKHGVAIPDSIQIISPVGYFQMLALLKNSRLVLTDSGGVQEEAFILRKPLMTIRDSTERPETLSANFLINRDPHKFNSAWKEYENMKVSWTDVLGNGDAAIQITEILEKGLS